MKRKDPGILVEGRLIYVEALVIGIAYLTLLKAKKVLNIVPLILPFLLSSQFQLWETLNFSSQRSLVYSLNLP